MVLVFLHVDYLTKHNALQIHPRCGKWKDFFLLKRKSPQNISLTSYSNLVPKWTKGRLLKSNNSSSQIYKEMYGAPRHLFIL